MTHVFFGDYLMSTDGFFPLYVNILSWMLAKKGQGKTIHYPALEVKM